MTTSTTPQLKPAPEPDDLSREFFEGAQRGELMLVRCNLCQAWLAPATQICSECLGEDLRWERASGLGRVFTFGVMHQFYHPGFTNDLPYNVAIVELDEGPRMQTNLVGVDNADITVGMRVKACFPEHVPGMCLPKFAPAQE